MRRFFGAGSTLWEQLTGSLHVYALPGPALTAKVEPCREVLSGTGYCSAQPGGYLHATVTRLPWFRDRLGDAQVAALSDALDEVVAHRGPFTIKLGAPEVNPVGVTMGGNRSQAWDCLVSDVRKAAVTTLGTDPPLPRAPFAPHMTLGYGVAEGDATKLEGELRQAAPRLGGSVFVVGEICLLAVDQDPDRGVFTWQELSRHRFSDPDR